MPEQQLSPQKQTGAITRVDQLLTRLRAVTQLDPPPALRARLARMSSERLGPDRPHGMPRRSLPRRPAFTVPAIGLIAGLFLACAAFIGFWVQKASHHGRVNRIALESPAVPAAPVRRNTEARPAVSVRQRRIRVGRAGDYAGHAGDLVISLPYSDSAVHTGTGTTIQVSLSQEELLTLGVPVNPTMDDRRFIAEMVLGDDGLPRAITVPFPLTVIEGKR
jgi:hypothetical protein